MAYVTEAADARLQLRAYLKQVDRPVNVPTFVERRRVIERADRYHKALMLGWLDWVEHDMTLWRRRPVLRLRNGTAHCLADARWALANDTSSSLRPRGTRAFMDGWDYAVDRLLSTKPG